MRTRPFIRSCMGPNWNLAIAALVVSGVLGASRGTAVAASTSLSRPPPPDVGTAISDLITDASRRFAVPSSWITQVMQVESRGRVGAVSPKGAVGLMQVMPDTYAVLAAR